MKIEYISIITSSIALIISIFTFIRIIYSERFTIDFNLIKWFGSNDNEFFLYIDIINNSKLPITITQIDVFLDFDFKQDYKLTGTGFGQERLIYTSNDEKMFSNPYPISLGSYSGNGGYYFIKSNYPFYNYEDRNVKIVLKTNRGIKTKVIKLTHNENVFRAMQDASGSISFLRDEHGNKLQYKDTK